MQSFRLRLGIVVGIGLGFLFYILCFSAPFSFPKQLLLPVHSGETGADIANALKTDHAIRSELLFRLLLRLYGGETHIASGTYYFSEPTNAFTIAWRLKIGDFNIEPEKITIPEGTDVVHVSAILQQNLPTFDSGTFLTLATPNEGYLFPDTYFFYPGESMTEIVQTMKDNFTAHIASTTLQMDIVLSGHTLTQIVTMASLLEKEAPDINDRRIISGILWKRISIGMPLQVDAVFPYITGDKTPTRADLSIDSPYNTYLHMGLPPGPITNPGVDSILAAASPTASPYLYYLSDKKGNFHYSATYAGQLANEKKYLP
jgi:UPF0755 protein